MKAGNEINYTSQSALLFWDQKKVIIHGGEIHWWN